MKLVGQEKFTIEAEGAEIGGKRLEGIYDMEVLNLAYPLKGDIPLAKDDADVVLALGGITTVKFLHIKVRFPSTYTETDATIEVIINDGGGEKTITCTSITLENTDITSIKLTNNSHDTTGSAATVFFDLGGV